MNSVSSIHSRIAGDGFSLPVRAILPELPGFCIEDIVPPLVTIVAGNLRAFRNPRLPHYIPSLAECLLEDLARDELLAGQDDFGTQKVNVELGRCRLRGFREPRGFRSGTSGLLARW